MKRYWYGILPFLMIVLFVRCEDDTVYPVDTLIAEIENAQDKINIDPRYLPEPVKALIEDAYFDTYIESAALVPGKGFEVILGNEDRLYFRENGTELRGHLRGPRPGPCGYSHLVAPQDLPGAIKEYISSHFPDATILRAKYYPRGFVVLVSGHRLLIFNNEKEFVAISRAFYFCDQVGYPLHLDTLPDGVGVYIDMYYPGAELVKAFLVRGRIVVGILMPDGRKIVVFDQEGNFLFTRS